jgi:anti-anti-sigma factor
MNAQAKTDAYGNIIISLQGQLTFEMNCTLREELFDLSRSVPQIPIVIDLRELQFVGSSGIGHFVETINKINRKRMQIRLLHPSEEFRKVFRIYRLNFYDLTLIQAEHLPYLNYYQKQLYLNLESIVD